MAVSVLLGELTSGVVLYLSRPELVVRPYVLPRHRAQARRRRVAQDLQVAGRLDLRALGERADPAVQERAAEDSVSAYLPYELWNQIMYAAIGTMPATTTAARRSQPTRRASRPTRTTTSSGSPTDLTRVAYPISSPANGHGEDRGPVVPAQDHHGHRHQEDEQRVGGDHVLEVQLVARRTAPAARAASLPTRAARGGGAARRWPRPWLTPIAACSSARERGCAAAAAGQGRTGSRSAGPRRVCASPRRRGSCRSR